MAPVSPLCQLQENTTADQMQHLDDRRLSCYKMSALSWVAFMSQVALQPDLLYLWAMALKLST